MGDKCYDFQSHLPECYDFKSHLPECYMFYSYIPDDDVDEPEDPEDPNIDQGEKPLPTIIPIPEEYGLSNIIGIHIFTFEILILAIKDGYRVIANLNYTRDVYKHIKIVSMKYEVISSSSVFYDCLTSFGTSNSEDLAIVNRDNFTIVDYLTLEESESMACSDSDVCAISSGVFSADYFCTKLVSSGCDDPIPSFFHKEYTTQGYMGCGDNYAGIKSGGYLYGRDNDSGIGFGTYNSDWFITIGGEITPFTYWWGECRVGLVREEKIYPDSLPSPTTFPMNFISDSRYAGLSIRKHSEPYILNLSTKEWVDTGISCYDWTMKGGIIYYVTGDNKIYQREIEPDN